MHTHSLSLFLRFSCPYGSFLFCSLFLHNAPPFWRFSIVAVCCGFAISALSFRCPFLPFYLPFMCLCSSFLRLFAFFISAENNLCFYANASADVPSEPWQLSVGRRATKQRSRSDCHSCFSFSSRLPHTSSSLVLLRVLVPNVKRTQLEAQHSVLVQPLEIHFHHTAQRINVGKRAQFHSSMLGLINRIFFFRGVRDAFRYRTFIFPFSF